MNTGGLPPASNCAAQVYLMDRDAGLLCRILSLYASRGLDLTFVRYSYAAQSVMRLEVGVADASPDVMESVRVLVEKASTFVGILAAAELPADMSRAA